LSRKAFRPRKRFGQNFLYDPAIARRIVDAADLSAADTVIELGAGKGILTVPLAETGARLIAIEIDRDLYAELEKKFGAPAGREGVEILNIDFTKVSLTGLIAPRGQERCVLMGNLPYHLTRDVLFSFLVDECEVIGAAYLMVQKEVGDRIVSRPGSRVYGITSVILQSLYSIRTLFRVAPGSFNPKPKVASVVLEFQPLEEPLVQPEGLRMFIGVVKSLFQQRRKTIHNTIRAFYSTAEPELNEIERKTGIDLQKRPEALSKEEFLQLSQALAEIKSVS
jgi:16S rRNA (adenine1518-N6/adenine1519-N6)-dimethyltransferase